MQRYIKDVRMNQRIFLLINFQTVLKNGRQTDAAKERKFKRQSLHLETLFVLTMFYWLSKLSAPDGTHVGPMNLAIRVLSLSYDGLFRKTY